MNINEERVSGKHLGLDTSRLFVQYLSDKTSRVIKKIQIVPDETMVQPEIRAIMAHEGRGIVTLQDELSGINEVLLSKSATRLMFNESFQYIYRTDQTSHVREDLKVASIVLLFMTPVDTHALKILWNCLRVDKEDVMEVFVIVAALLTCNYERTNKSSCLWELFKKLYVLILSSSWIVEPPECKSYEKLTRIPNLQGWLDRVSNFEICQFGCSTCLRSVLVHPRNYYACNLLRFLLSTCEDSGLKLHLIIQIIDFHNGEYDDYSLWMVVLDVCLDAKYRQMEYYREQRKMIDGRETTLPSLDVLRIYLKIKNCYTTSYGRFLTMLKLHYEFGLGLELETNLKNRVYSFEKAHGVVDIRKIEGPVNISSDALLKEEYEKALNIKRALCECQKNRKQHS